MLTYLVRVVDGGSSSYSSVFQKTFSIRGVFTNSVGASFMLPLLFSRPVASGGAGTQEFKFIETLFLHLLHNREKSQGLQKE